MPVYAYECEQGHYSEREYPICDFPLSIACPECGDPARKIIVNVSPMKDSLPAYMRAGPEADVIDRDRAYKQSDRFYEKCKATETSGGTVITGSEVGAD